VAPPIEVIGPTVPGSDRALDAAALEFLSALEMRFRDARAAILASRTSRAAELAAGAALDFLPATAAVRADRTWRVAEAPPDLEDRRVEITGPAEPKMMINALNSGARVFMADLEDALSPTWANVVGGQAALMDAVRGRLAFTAPDGRRYAVGASPAVLLVRPRGWHLDERHVRVDGEPMSASLFDAGLYLFHNAAERLARGTGPYLYLPKLQSHLEARLWNEVFLWAQDALGIPRGSVRATILIETIHAAFEMEEILFELRDHAAGLNAGRWDYLFSCIKTFGPNPLQPLPDRARLTMTVPFMRAYTELLVATCHQRGAHAIGGMAAYIPSRRDPAVNATAMARVRDDKERESRDGFDGTWVAHPDLVPLATEVFDGVLGAAPHQKRRLREDVAVTAAQLADVRVDGGEVTEAGVRTNVSVAIQYLDAWLSGNGAAAINNLMEDAATAEISRSQLWQWRVTGVPVVQAGTAGEGGAEPAGHRGGAPLTAERYRQIRGEELARLGGAVPGRDRRADAAAVLDALVLADDFEAFLTPRAYRLLD
jgi:malate synthase